jgi:hypothetical protein
MITINSSQLLRRIRKGVFGSADTAWLEQVRASQFVEELRTSRFRLTIHERSIGRKWEVSLARTLRAELTFRPVPDATAVLPMYIPSYIDCILLNAEDDRLTGVSTLTRLTLWPVSKPVGSLTVKSGRGFKLDRAPDGWSIKAMQPRTVKLSRAFLRQRGWQFEQLDRFLPGRDLTS